MADWLAARSLATNPDVSEGGWVHSHLYARRIPYGHW
jgi:hypothetical protein